MSNKIGASENIFYIAHAHQPVMTETESTISKKIITLEKKLLNAFCNYDVTVLDELIHDDALFVLPNAQTISKATVLDNYRNRKAAMEIIPGDHAIKIIGDTAVVSVSLESHVKTSDHEVRSQFRYLRVWKLFNGTWKIIATGGIPAGA